MEEFQHLPIQFGQVLKAKNFNRCGILLVGLEGPTLTKTRCFCEAYTGLPVVSATENEKALNCVVLKYSIPVSEE